MLVAQVTDPHVSLPGARLFGGYDPAEALRAVVARLVALRPRPDFVFFTGDLTEGGKPAEYAHFLALIADLDLPAAAIPGNHDRRDAFLTGLQGSRLRIGTDPNWLHLAIEGLPLRLIGLDTLGLEGEAGGLLDEGRLAWLERRLDEAPGVPALIFMHHPPFRTGLPSIDRWMLANPGPLAATVARHDTVRRVACGHGHRTAETRFGGTAAGICPSVAWATPLFDPAARAPLVPQAPGFQLHLWDPAFGLATLTEFLAG